MKELSKDQDARREKTLLTALLLSTPGPLVIILAVLSSHSSTQLADFIRRGVELVAMFIAWWVFRRLHRGTEMAEDEQKKLERTAGLSVSTAMIASGLVMLSVALSRLTAFEPGGKVYTGLIVAILGLLVNTYYWRRYTGLNRESYNPVIEGQQGLYRAKATVDLCVVIALAAVAIAPGNPATRYVDVTGSIVVAMYLLFNGIRSARINLGGGREILRRICA